MIAYVKTTPLVPVAEVALEMTGAGGLTVIVSEALPVPPALLARIVTGKVPVWVGVPLMTPEELFSDMPAGKVPVSLKLVGEFVAAIV